MKFILFFFLSLSSFTCCFAQGDVLPLDERGKFIYYEVIAAKGIETEALKIRVIAYFEQEKLKHKNTITDTSFFAYGKLIIQKTVLVLSHPSGEVLFKLNVEIRPEKYRFWLTDFNFIPYQRDRYGNFVAGSAKGTPLERNVGKLNAAQWKEYQTQTAKYAHQFAAEFKKFMTEKPQLMVTKEKTVVKKEW